MKAKSKKPAHLRRRNVIDFAEIRRTRMKPTSPPPATPPSDEKARKFWGHMCDLAASGFNAAIWHGLKYGNEAQQAVHVACEVIGFRQKLTAMVATVDHLPLADDGAVLLWLSDKEEYRRRAVEWFGHRRSQEAAFERWAGSGLGLLYLIMKNTVGDPAGAYGVERVVVKLTGASR